MEQIDLIDNIISKYFSSVEYDKFNNFLKSNLNKNKILKINNKREINSKTKSKIFNSAYISYLITYICENFKVADQIQLLSNIGESLIHSGMNDLALKLFQTIIQIGDSNLNYKSMYAYALLEIGIIYSDKGAWAKSENFIRHAKQIFSKLNDVKGLVRCFNLLGILYIENGNISKGIHNFERCLLLLNPTTDLMLIAKIEMNLGAIYNRLYNFSKSLFFYHNSLAKFEKCQDIVNITMLKFNIGLINYEMNRMDLALKEFDDCLLLALKCDLLVIVGRIYDAKAKIYVVKRDIELSRAFWKKASEIHYKTNDHMLKYVLMKTKGIISREQKKFKLSENCFLDCKRQIRKSENEIFMAEIEFELGILYKNWDKNKKALDSYNYALRIFNKMNISHMVKKIETQINEIVD